MDDQDQIHLNIETYVDHPVLRKMGDFIHADGFGPCDNCGQSGRLHGGGSRGERIIMRCDRCGGIAIQTKPDFIPNRFTWETRLLPPLIGQDKGRQRIELKFKPHDHSCRYRILVNGEPQQIPFAERGLWCVAELNVSKSEQYAIQVLPCTHWTDMAREASV